EVARNVCTLRRRAESAEALGVRFALCGNHDGACDGFLEQRTEAPVAIGRAARQTRAGDDEGHAAKPALTVQVRPQLRLDDDREPRARSAPVGVNVVTSTGIRG